MQLATSVVFAVLFLLQNVIVQAQLKDIVQTATDNGTFTTLVRALTAADLVDTLKGPGPFTVFAPTDAAFKKLPAETLEDLLKPENKEKLSKILKYHVIGKRVTSGDINNMTLPSQVITLSDLRLIVDKNGNAVKVNDATVTVPDVSNTNGIIHIIDTVLLPPTDIAYTTLDTIFKTLVELMTAANLTETLKGDGPFTLFAPTDEAFRNLPEGVLADLWQPENKQKLTRILQYHVVGDLVTTGASNRMTLPAKVKMLEGGTVTLTKDGNSFKINDANVTKADVFNTNGIIHRIDTVLMPASSSTSFYLNQGLFVVFVSGIILSYHFSA